MKRYVRYLIGLLRHKWFVFLECRKLGLSLSLSILHDWTKFSIVEFVPYVKQFYSEDGTKRSVRDKTGAYDPLAQSVEFRTAWLHHQRNKHHWQAWCVIGDYGELDPLPMPNKFILEMIADWNGAGKSYSGEADASGWYQANKNKMRLHPDTRAFIEAILEDDK